MVANSAVSLSGILLDARMVQRGRERTRAYGTSLNRYLVDSIDISMDDARSLPPTTMTLDFKNLEADILSFWASTSSDDNASTLPCDCLPPPPDFHLPPPPILIMDFRESDLASIFAADPVLQSCPSTSLGNFFAATDNLTPPAWINDGEINVIKTDNFGQYSSTTVFAAVAGAATLLLLLSAFLVAYYCRSKRTISAGSFICLRGKKAASLNRQQSDRYNTTSLAMMTNRHSRSQSSKFVQGESNWENEVQKCNLTRGKEDGDEIPVGADWTFRRIKKAGDSSGVEAKELPIYDVPQTYPKPPTIIVTFPDTVRSQSTFERGSPPRFPLPATPNAAYLPPIHRRLHCSPTSSYDNHNPVYEEISLHSESMTDTAKCPHEPVSNGAKTRSKPCQYADRKSEKTASNFSQKCSNQHDESGIYACSDCSGRESGYGTEGCPKGHNYVAFCTACANDQLGNDGRKLQGPSDDRERRIGLNNNGEEIRKDSKYVNRKMKTMISPKRPKRYYTNGSLAVSLAEGFDIDVQSSAYV